VGAESFHADNMTKRAVAFHNFTNPRVTPRSAHTTYLCVLCAFQNKQRLFPYTASTDWFFGAFEIFQKATIYFCSVSFLEWETFRTKVVQKIKTHILCPINFFVSEDRTV